MFLLPRDNPAFGVTADEGFAADEPCLDSTEMACVTKGRCGVTPVTGWLALPEGSRSKDADIPGFAGSLSSSCGQRTVWSLGGDTNGKTLKAKVVHAQVGQPWVT